MADANTLLVEGKKLLAEQNWKGAVAKLQESASADPASWEAHSLLSTALLKAANTPEAKQHALAEAEHAVDLAADRGKAILALAEALAANGRKEEGLTRLEDACALGSEKEQKAAVACVADFRRRFSLGQLWQFFTLSMDPILESSSMTDSRAQLLAGVIPSNAYCRKNRVGAIKPLSELLAGEEASIELLVRPARYHVSRGAGIGFAVAVVLGVVAALYNVTQIPGIDGSSVLLAVLVAWGGLILSARAHWAVLIPAYWILSAMGLNVGFIAGLALGIPVGIFLSGLMGAVAGAVVGCVVGIARLPFLPRLPKPATAAHPVTGSTGSALS